MKLVKPLNAISAIREVVEDYQPENGVVQKDLIELVRTSYEFQTFPIVTPGVMLPPVFTFGSGRFVGKGQSFAINQLLMRPDGDIVAAVTTDQADLVIDDLARLLDKHLGYHILPMKSSKLHVSNIIVEFDKGLEEYISKLAAMAAMINDTRPGGRIVNIKRLVFGSNAEAFDNADVLVKIENSEFVIERRAGLPFEANRYFCSAPMTTREHIDALERFEAIARGEGN
jgi:hypothetical protein